MSEAGPRSLTLPGGRALSYYELGDPAGPAVLLFHGAPQAAVCWTFADEVAHGLGVRAIAPDRPGIGRSTLQPHRRLVDWPVDVAHLADALGLERFATLGWSAGGPYALACAALLPGRVQGVGIAAGVCPLDWVPGLAGLNPQDARLVRLVRRSPRLAQAVLRLSAAATRMSPALAVRIARHALSPSERDTWRRHAAELADMRFFLDAFAQGAEGVLADYLVYAEPWGFELDSVRVPVRLWYGDDDSLVPLEHGRLLAARLPDARLEVIADAGHLLPYDYVGEMLTGLTGSPSGA